MQSMRILEDRVRTHRHLAVFGFQLAVQQLLLLKLRYKIKLSTSVLHKLHTPASPHLPW